MGRWGGNSGQAHCMDFLPNKLFTPKFVLFLGQVHMHRGTFHSAISENFGGFRKLEPSHYFFTWGLKPLPPVNLFSDLLPSRTECYICLSSIILHSIVLFSCLRSACPVLPGWRLPLLHGPLQALQRLLRLPLPLPEDPGPCPGQPGPDGVPGGPQPQEPALLLAGVLPHQAHPGKLGKGKAEGRRREGGV